MDSASQKRKRESSDDGVVFEDVPRGETKRYDGIAPLAVLCVSRLAHDGIQLRGLVAKELAPADVLKYEPSHERVILRVTNGPYNRNSGRLTRCDYAHIISVGDKRYVLRRTERYMHNVHEQGNGCGHQTKTRPLGTDVCPLSNKPYIKCNIDAMGFLQDFMRDCTPECTCSDCKEICDTMYGVGKVHTSECPRANKRVMALVYTPYECVQHVGY